MLLIYLVNPKILTHELPSVEMKCKIECTGLLGRCTGTFFFFLLFSCLFKFLVFYFILFFFFTFFLFFFPPLKGNPTSGRRCVLYPKIIAALLLPWAAIANSCLSYSVGTGISQVHDSLTFCWERGRWRRDRRDGWCYAGMISDLVSVNRPRGHYYLRSFVQYRTVPR